jgi:hypothetical protein
MLPSTAAAGYSVAKCVPLVHCEPVRPNMIAAAAAATVQVRLLLSLLPLNKLKTDTL